eukprot:3981256-Amphidinium_carterae.4
MGPAAMQTTSRGHHHVQKNCFNSGEDTQGPPHKTNELLVQRRVLMILHPHLRFAWGYPNLAAEVWHALEKLLPKAFEDSGT